MGTVFLPQKGSEVVALTWLFTHSLKCGAASQIAMTKSRGRPAQSAMAASLGSSFHGLDLDSKIAASYGGVLLGSQAWSSSRL